MPEFDLVHEFPAMHVGVRAEAGRLAEICFLPRSVGQACGANWFPLLIPCHRVLGSGNLGGFGNHGEGFHLEIRRWLLQHECCPIPHE